MKKMMMLTTTAYMSERFNRSNIEILESMGYEVHVVANFDKGNPTTQEVLDEFRIWVEAHNGKCYSISVTNNPFDVSTLIRSYKEILDLVKEHKYEFIHCHTPVAGVVGRVVAHKTKTKVMYTAHGFHFFNGAPLINWLIYYPVERFLSKWTDILVTINNEDYERAKKSFYSKRIEYISGIGIDLEKFKKDVIDSEKKRATLGVSTDDVMMLSVGELSKRKNHSIVIKAIAKIGNPHIKYFICGQGKLRKELEILIRDLKLQNQVFLLGYREDISELCQCTNLYIFPSMQEGLPVALMEAIACKIPVVCSRIRGNTDLIKNEAYIFNPKDEDEVIKCIVNAISDDNNYVVEENYSRLKRFDVKSVNDMMKEMYLF